MRFRKMAPPAAKAMHIIVPTLLRLGKSILPTAGIAPAPGSSSVVSAPDNHETRRSKQKVILCLALVLATLAIYNPVVHNGFTNLDDDLYIVNNPHVRAGLSWNTVKWAFTSVEAANWHPLTWISHALDYQIFKLNPVGPHYVNVLFHAANAVLLFILLEGATGLIWPSITVAALFALHPINVESVAWAAERKNVLSMLFFLIALLAYQRYVRRPDIARYALVATIFALGLMAKPEIITLPFVLLLWDYWPLHRVQGMSATTRALPGIPPRSFKYLFLEKVPLLLLSAGSGVITIVAQSGGHAVRPAPIWVRCGNAIVAYVRYLGKAFWPSRLAVLYPHPGRLLPTWQIIASATLLLALTVTIVRSRRDYAIMGWFWFLGTLVPVIGLVQVGSQAMADRYAYISFIGLFILLIWAMAEFARVKRIAPEWLAAPMLAVLLIFGFLTYRQIGFWQNSETLWRHALSVTENNYTAHDFLARDLTQQGRIDEAIAEHNAAEELHAYSSEQLISIALFEESHGRMQAATAQLGRAADAATDANSRATALAFLGLAFMHSGELDRAGQSYVSALQQNPDNGVALIGSGLLAERDGNFNLAAQQIDHAMRAEPTDVGYVLLADAWQRAGQTAAAAQAIEQAQKISLNIEAAKKSAAEVLRASGLSPEIDSPATSEPTNSSR